MSKYKRIKILLHEEFDLDQYERVARKLREIGVSSEEFMQFVRTPAGRLFPDPHTCNTYGALRYLEVTQP